MGFIRLIVWRVLAYIYGMFGILLDSGYCSGWVWLCVGVDLCLWIPRKVWVCFGFTGVCVVLWVLGLMMVFAICCILCCCLDLLIDWFGMRGVAWLLFSCVCDLI